MTSFDITYTEQKRVTIYIPEGYSDKEKKQLADWHLQGLPGDQLKILSIVPTPLPETQND